MAKTYSQTYLFKQYSGYERDMYSFIMTADRINTSSKEFEDVLYDFKRRNTSNSLLKVIISNNIILGVSKTRALPKSFKVFTAKDIKEDKNAYKVFIDVTDCITFKNGQWVCNKLDWLVSYIINAMVCYIYTMNENRFIGNNSITVDGGTAFVRCFSYIIDRMYKISTVQQLRKRIEYLSAIYYQVCILGKDYNRSYDSIKANAIKISDIDIRDTQLIDVSIEDKDLVNLDTLINTMIRIFSFKDLKTVNVIDLWMKSFGTGTVFGLEYFPAFSAMLTNTYIGGNIDQQITIEKVIGTPLVTYTKTILQIGASV